MFSFRLGSCECVHIYKARCLCLWENITKSVAHLFGCRSMCFPLLWDFLCQWELCGNCVCLRVCVLTYLCLFEYECSAHKGLSKHYVSMKAHPSTCNPLPASRLFIRNILIFLRTYFTPFWYPLIVLWEQWVLLVLNLLWHQWDLKLHYPLQWRPVSFSHSCSCCLHLDHTLNSVCCTLPFTIGRMLCFPKELVIHRPAGPPHLII